MSLSKKCLAAGKKFGYWFDAVQTIHIEFIDSSIQASSKCGDDAYL